MASIDEIAKQFVDYYYATFDRNRAELSPLYKDHSMLTFEGQAFKGTQSIVEKLSGLPFQKVQHQVTTVDCQPSNPQSGPILVAVTGRLLVDQEQNPMQFSQSFQLVPEGNSFYVFNYHVLSEANKRFDDVCLPIPMIHTAGAQQLTTSTFHNNLMPQSQNALNAPKSDMGTAAKSDIVTAAMSLRRPKPKKSGPSAASKKSIDQLLIDVLLKEDLVLLDIICNSATTLVGDQAAAAAKGILKILFTRMEREKAEDFIKKSLKSRVLDYRSKSRDLSDITRDNSLVTMLLTAFARTEGQAYLAQTLSKPLNTNYSILSNCELDPQKLKGDENVNVQQVIDQNRQNLEKVCEIVFTAIFESRTKLPKSMIGMCAFLTEMIDEVMRLDPATIPRRPSADNSSIDTSSIIEPTSQSASVKKGGSLFMARLSTGSRATGSPTPKQKSSSNFGSLFPILGKKRFGSRDLLSDHGSPGKVDSTSVLGSVNTGTVLSGSDNSIHSSKSALSPLPTSPLSPLSGGGGAAKKRELSSDQVTHTKKIEKTPISSSTSMPSGNLYGLSGIADVPSLVEGPPKAPSVTSSHEQVVSADSVPFLTGEIIMATDEPNNAPPQSVADMGKAEEPVKAQETTTHNEQLENNNTAQEFQSRTKSLEFSASKELLQTQSRTTIDIPSNREIQRNNTQNSSNVGMLALSEKIVGSFLFLRFIVPGVTTPDLNGIMMEKITPSVRRGLVLCGKMITALCNDTEFGLKETSLMPCNPFLEKYRLKMKEFLGATSKLAIQSLSSSRGEEVDSTEETNATGADIPNPWNNSLKGNTYNRSDGNLAQSLQTSASKSREKSPLRSFTTINKRVSGDPTSHSRAISHPLPSQVPKTNSPEPHNNDSNLAGKNTTTKSKKEDNHLTKSPTVNGMNKFYSLSMDNLKRDSPRGEHVGSEQDLSLALVTIDSDIISFFQSIHQNFDKMGRDIYDRRPLMKSEDYSCLVKSFTELKIYLNTGGYVPESNTQNFQTRKRWWVKMIKFLSSK